MEIEVYRIYRFDTDRPLKAFVDIVVNDVLLIKGVRVMQGKSGLFVAMPREQAKDNKWYESVRCLTTDTRDNIIKVVLDAFMCDMTKEDIEKLNKGMSNADNTEEDEEE